MQNNTITVNRFQPRDYQIPICDAIENKGYKRAIAIMPRRCLSGESKILMADRSCKFLKDIKVGDRIISWNGSWNGKNNFVVDVVKNVWKTGIKKTLAVQALKYEPIITSEDHLFAFGTTWIRAADLTPGDPVVMYSPKEDIGAMGLIVQKKAHGEEELYDLETERYHNFIANDYVVHNSGKDLTAWNLCIRQCLRKTCLVYYCLPTYSQAKKTVFDAIAIDGTKFLDYIPREVIASINTQEMKIRFRNNSILQLIGGDTYDTSLVGTNPYAIVFSEYALMDPKAYQFARPILAANNGWCLILSTPRGRNALWELYNNTKDLPDWFCYKLTVEDTKHITPEVLANERSQMSEELYMQEYMTSFDRGVEGSYYAKNIDELRRKNQISTVDWEPGLKTFTAWDIGVHDSTCIIFFQVSQHNNVIRIIDCYSNANVGLDHYAKVIQQKPYVYGKHFGPPDLKVREWAGGAVTRIDKARDLGIDFTIVPALSIDDGIEGVWTNFHKMWFDEVKCKPLIHALENYRREWDDKLNRYKDHPLHSAESNWADALRYLCAGLSHTEQGITAEELEVRYQRAMYGQQATLPFPFGNTPRRY